MKKIHVLKFGGTSVSSRERWETIFNILEQKISEGIQPFVVCSAIRGISNLLESLMREAPIQNSAWEKIFETIKKIHEELAVELSLSPAILDKYFDELHRIALGASLTGEVSPRLWAKTLAMGELLLTRLGATYLANKNLPAQWLDARDFLYVDSKNENKNNNNDNNQRRHYLSSNCDFSPDSKLKSYIKDNPLTITQGFIASDDKNETVLLGRGGSDTSAAYFAAKIGANALEIWTDVPGMFTGNPRAIPNARLLKVLHYDEAQEIATTGAKVLHPRCIDPVRRYGIPLTIRCTQAPYLLGTIISENSPDLGPQVKALSSKDGIVLISMSTVGMWQQVGFLADIFGVFKKHAFSIDLVATSETNVTVTLDPGANPLDEKNIQPLIDELNEYCVADVIGPCTAISLVGQKIRAILHRLGSTLEAFEEKEIFSDNTIQVGGEHTTAWWQEKKMQLLEISDLPAYVYDLPTIEKQAQSLLSIQSLDRVYFAIKANDNEEILGCLEAKGIHFECVSAAEVDYVFSLFPDIDPKRISFTPNFSSREEFEHILKLGTYVTVDSLFILQEWGTLFSGKEILIRIDPGEGDGHHRFVKTAGSASKFGISLTKVEALKALCKTKNITVMGIHAHIGSGILKTGWWAKTGAVLAKVAEHFPDVKVLNLGGGLGVPEKAWQSPLDIVALDKELEQLKNVYKKYDLWMEPGRYFVAEASVILARVTQIKSKGNSHYVGIETGMNSLIRPALYGAYHRIVNLTRFNEPLCTIVDIVGPICESGDVLGHKRNLPISQERDVLLIANAGAYGHTMSSFYNRRRPAKEICLTRP